MLSPPGADACDDVVADLMSPHAGHGDRPPTSKLVAKVNRNEFPNDASDVIGGHDLADEGRIRVIELIAEIRVIQYAPEHSLVPPEQGEREAAGDGDSIAKGGALERKEAHGA